MKKRTIGATGLRGSQVGLGCNNFGWTIDEARSQAVVDAAIDLGVDFFDVADAYGEPRGRSEEILGKALGRDARTLSSSSSSAFPPMPRSATGTLRAAT